ncbi:immunity 21 family protein [bacterium]|nr:immunity 21 family protein [bacterium]
MKLDWLDDGSLIILLPEPLLNEWHGVDSDDYDRACAISNSWLNTISVPGGHGFLLGGDSGMVLAIPSANGATSLIRWVYANDEDELVEFALQCKSVTQSEPDFVFNNTFAKWSLFNAAANPSSDSLEMRSIGLPFGQIRIETVYCESKTNAAIVYRFWKSA